eukprot:TRINITY_DN3115_c1_g1_i1.p4 TRINITY_DN3115_c1_g1~~TRINITY_DN3115_c1_g1_i1.p4  ORF type:complete len:124 (-),score=12.00 TRINITY_DN3115_c1_g1_i1:643-1014(-)
MAPESEDIDLEEDYTGGIEQAHLLKDIVFAQQLFHGDCTNGIYQAHLLNTVGDGFQLFGRDYTIGIEQAHLLRVSGCVKQPSDGIGSGVTIQSGKIILISAERRCTMLRNKYYGGFGGCRWGQ